jgi:predicted small metal-binding protein
MMTIACKDVSGMECDFVAEGETAEAVKAMAMEHAGSAHAEAMAAMTDEQKAEMSAKVDSMLAAE